MSDKNNSNPTLVIKLKDGEVKITLFKDLAPNHVQRISQLAKEGKYNNVVFHREIDELREELGEKTGIWSENTIVGAKKTFSVNNFKIDQDQRALNAGENPAMKPVYERPGSEE